MHIAFNHSHHFIPHHLNKSGDEGALVVKAIKRNKH